MLELLSRHTVDGCTYLQAIIMITLLVIVALSIPYMIYQDIKKPSQQEGNLTEGRHDLTTISNISRDGGKVKGETICNR